MVNGGLQGSAFAGDFAAFARGAAVSGRPGATPGASAPAPGSGAAGGGAGTSATEIAGWAALTGSARSLVTTACGRLRSSMRRASIADTVAVASRAAAAARTVTVRL